MTMFVPLHHHTVISTTMIHEYGGVYQSALERKKLFIIPYVGLNVYSHASMTVDADMSDGR